MSIDVKLLESFLADSRVAFTHNILGVVRVQIFQADVRVLCEDLIPRTENSAGVADIANKVLRQLGVLVYLGKTLQKQGQDGSIEVVLHAWQKDPCGIGFWHSWFVDQFSEAMPNRARYSARGMADELWIRPIQELSFHVPANLGMMHLPWQSKRTYALFRLSPGYELRSLFLEKAHQHHEGYYKRPAIKGFWTR